MNIPSVNKPDRNLDAEKRSITGEVAGVVQRLLTVMVGEMKRKDIQEARRERGA